MSLPVTLLTGPSTTLRDNLVRCLVLRRPSLVAVVYDVVPQGLLRTVVDASGTQQREELELTGCCLSCTVREDAGPTLSHVAGAARWGEGVVALPASLQPEGLTPWLQEVDGIRLDTVTCVVDARLLRAQVSGDDLLADRGLAAAPSDRRSTAELVLSQIEEADVLAVADLHRLGTAPARTLQALLAHLSPLAVQVVLAPGGLGCDDVVSTGRRSPATTSSDRERLTGLAAELCPPACGVTTVRWEAERPLHSQRLSQALPEVVAGVVRSRGHVWLADRPRQRVRWESAGASLALGDQTPWRSLPGCALVLTGVDLDADALRARLDACLTTDAELAGAPTWSDPFQAALGPGEHLPQP
jgi:G3E family GTPase